MRPDGAHQFLGSLMMLAILFLVALLLCGRASAQTPTTHTAQLTWTASTSAGTAGFDGYNVRWAPGACGASGQSFTLATATPITATAYTLPGIPDSDAQVCFEVTAVRTTGGATLESPPLTYTAGVPPFAAAGPLGVSWQQ